jgi:hypothetical protein
MTSLDRAKQFLAGKARALALSAIPLAAVAVAPQANGAAVFTPVGCGLDGDVGISASGGTCGITTLGTAPNGVNGLHLVADTNWTVSGNSGGRFSATIFWDASVNGQVPGTLPVSWDFDITSPSGGFQWQIHAFVNDASLVGIASGTGTSAQGTGSLTLGMPVTSVSFRLVVDGGVLPADTIFQITVPDNSIDINPSAVPEPGTALLLIPGLGYLAVRVRRARKP